MRVGDRFGTNQLLGVQLDWIFHAVRPVLVRRRMRRTRDIKPRARNPAHRAAAARLARHEQRRRRGGGHGLRRAHAGMDRAVFRGIMTRFLNSRKFRLFCDCGA